jgi:hypothetical protein
MFMVRELEVSLEAIDRYWMWATGLEVLSNPTILLFGVAPGRPLDVNAPEALQDLWTQQTDTLSGLGTFPYNFHAFWLRLAITFGVPCALLVLVAALTSMARSRQPIYRYLIGLFVLSGFTMGSMYLSNVGVPLLLALAISKREPDGT